MTNTKTNYIDQLEARRAVQAIDQAQVNERHGIEGSAAAVAMIRTLAYAEHAEHRQYDGFWDGEEWTLARVSCLIRSKGGLQADTGDVVLFRWGHGSPEFYSVRLGWMCSASYGVLPIRFCGRDVGPFPA